MGNANNIHMLSLKVSSTFLAQLCLASLLSTLPKVMVIPLTSVEIAGFFFLIIAALVLESFCLVVIGLGGSGRDPHDHPSLAEDIELLLSPRYSMLLTMQW